MEGEIDEAAQRKLLAWFVGNVGMEIQDLHVRSDLLSPIIVSPPSLPLRLYLPLILLHPGTHHIVYNEIYGYLWIHSPVTKIRYSGHYHSLEVIKLQSSQKACSERSPTLESFFHYYLTRVLSYAVTVVTY